MYPEPSHCCPVILVQQVTQVLNFAPLNAKLFNHIIQKMKQKAFILQFEKRKTVKCETYKTVANTKKGQEVSVPLMFCPHAAAIPELQGYRVSSRSADKKAYIKNVTCFLFTATNWIFKPNVRIGSELTKQKAIIFRSSHPVTAFVLHFD